MAYSFNNPKAPSTRRTQYFEMFGNRAIYSDGWVAATTPLTAPWSPIAKKADPIHGFDWELYKVDEDFSQSKNLAAAYPEKLRELQLLFYGEHFIDPSAVGAVKVSHHVTFSGTAYLCMSPRYIAVI